MTSKEIKIKLKSANIAGLQVADLLAYPCKNEILFENSRITDQDWQSQKFTQEICKCLTGKYNSHIFDGRISGYGKVFLA